MYEDGAPVRVFPNDNPRPHKPGRSWFMAVERIRQAGFGYCIRDGYFLDKLRARVST